MWSWASGSQHFEGTTILHNVGKYSPNYRATYPGRLEYVSLYVLIRKLPLYQMDATLPKYSYLTEIKEM